MNDAECANPQLLGWVKEWLDVARERNSKGFTTYKHAYDSLRACPITFQHPAELQQLKGFGPKLCERLTDLLKKHCQENGLPMPEHPQARKAAQNRNGSASESAGQDQASRQTKPRKKKSYVPAFRSGAYALIVGLATQSADASVGLTKIELIELAQPHCDASFTAPSDPTKFYTAWNSVKTLLQKELAYERGRPLRRYALTDEGWEVAQRIKETPHWQAENQQRDDNNPVTGHQPRLAQVENELGSGLNAEITQSTASEYQNVIADGPVFSENSALPSFTPITLEPGSFSVQLLLDVREVRAKTDRDYMKDELAKQGVTPIMRSLELGDAQWIAKCNDSTTLTRYGAEGDEIVLDWIVERKRLDDLIGSIKDGRFHEQKFRLKRSGVKKVIYIIEDISIDSGTLQKYEEAVQSAIASTQVVSEYFVKRTTKMDETIRYLARMTAMLKRTYERRPLKVVPTKVLTANNYIPLMEHLRENVPSEGHYVTYPAFASMSSKSEMLTLRDIFLKMLMTTKGVTGERALGIQKRWKTPYDFVRAFEACGDGEQGKKRKRELVSNEMGNLVGRKKITKPLSVRIAEVWGDI